MPRITLRGFRPSDRGPKQVLGKLESVVMELLWESPEQTVNEVEAKLQPTRAWARTTLLTTLDRLHRKGYLQRRREGKAFVYAPRYSREEFERKVAQEVLSGLLQDLSEPILSTFVDLVSTDERKLDQLETLIRKKREAE